MRNKTPPKSIWGITPNTNTRSLHSKSRFQANKFNDTAADWNRLSFFPATNPLSLTSKSRLHQNCNNIAENKSITKKIGKNRVVTAHLIISVTLFCPPFFYEASRDPIVQYFICFSKYNMTTAVSRFSSSFSRKEYLILQRKSGQPTQLKSIFLCSTCPTSSSLVELQFFSR